MTIPSTPKPKKEWPPRLWSYYDMTDVFLALIDGAIVADIPSERFASESKLPVLHGNMRETEYLSIQEHTHLICEARAGAYEEILEMDAQGDLAFLRFMIRNKLAAIRGEWKEGEA